MTPKMLLLIQTHEFSVPFSGILISTSNANKLFPVLTHSDVNHTPFLLNTFNLCSSNDCAYVPRSYIIPHKENLVMHNMLWYQTCADARLQHEFFRSHCRPGGGTHEAR